MSIIAGNDRKLSRETLWYIFTITRPTSDVNHFTISDIVEATCLCRARYNPKNNSLRVPWREFLKKSTGIQSDKRNNSHFLMQA